MKVRLYGIALLIVSLSGFHWLSRGFELSAVQRSTPLEIAVGAICVLAWLFGLPMMALGSGLFARAEISWPGGGNARRKHSSRTKG